MSKTDARIVRSRDQLRDALVALLHDRPLDQISVRDIAAAAGVGYTTYFRHYAGKDALLDDIAAEEIARLTALTAPVYASADSLAACVALCAYVDRERALWRALLTGAREKVREEMLRHGEAVIAGGARGGSLPPELGIALGVAVIVETLGWWLQKAEAWPVEEVAAMLDRSGIAPIAR